MEKTSKPKRYPVNPVEIVIFAVVTLVFINSVYNLFYGQSGIQAGTLSQIATNSSSEGRTPAASQTLPVIETKCDTPMNLNTEATRVRLSGPICGFNAASDGNKLVDTTIINKATEAKATVFTDLSSGKFSTDYITLNYDRNPIQIKFVYQTGKTVTQDLVITKKQEVSRTLRTNHPTSHLSPPLGESWARAVILTRVQIP